MVRAEAEVLFEEEEYLPVVLIECLSPPIEGGNLPKHIGEPWNECGCRDQAL